MQKMPDVACLFPRKKQKRYAKDMQQNLQLVAEKVASLFCNKLQVLLHVFFATSRKFFPAKKATIYGALWRDMTCKDKASYASSPLWVMFLMPSSDDNCVLLSSF